MAAVLGAVVLAVSIAGGNVLSLGSLVGLLFFAVAAVRYRLAQGA